MAIPMIAVGLLAYSSGPLKRIMANGVETAGSARASSLDSMAVQPATASTTPEAQLTDATFQVRNYGGKCLSFGAPLQTDPGASLQSGSSVYIYDCKRNIPIPQAGVRTHCLKSRPV